MSDRECFQFFRRGVAWGASEAQGWPLYRTAFDHLTERGWEALHAGGIAKMIDELRDPASVVLTRAVRDACLDHAGYDQIAAALLKDPRLKIEVRDA